MRKTDRKQEINMKKRINLFTGILLCTLLFCSCGNDETIDIFGSITGQVTDYSTGDPLTNAQVTLVPGANTVQTSNDGAFSFTNLDEGKYTVSVQKDGYQANRKDVIVISGEETKTVISLKTIPK